MTICGQMFEKYESFPRKVHKWTYCKRRVETTGYENHFRIQTLRYQN